MVKIDNWSVVSNNSDPYLAPEERAIFLSGQVYGHPNPDFPDGHKVVTSEIMEAEGKIITVRSGRKYALGEIHPAYREWLRENRPDWDPENPITTIG